MKWYYRLIPAIIISAFYHLANFNFSLEYVASVLISLPFVYVGIMFGERAYNRLIKKENIEESKK